MPKYYTEDTDGNRLIIERNHHFAAAEAHTLWFLAQDKSVGEVINVQESGFNARSDITSKFFHKSYFLGE